MLLRRLRNIGGVGRDELARHVTEFQQGHWEQLIREAMSLDFSQIQFQHELQRKKSRAGLWQPRAERKGNRFHEVDKS